MDDHQASTPIIGLDHAQVAAPVGSEGEARAFYGELVGLLEIEKPDALRARGGVWFTCGAQQLHVGVVDDFSPATKAHPALRFGSEISTQLPSDLLRPDAPCNGTTRSPPHAASTPPTPGATGSSCSPPTEPHCELLAASSLMDPMSETRLRGPTPSIDLALGDAERAPQHLPVR